MTNFLKTITKPKAVAIVQSQSAIEIIKKRQIDYIYHDHIYYHSATSLMKLIDIENIKLNNIEVVESKGGSFRLAMSKDAEHNNDAIKTINRLIKDEGD